MPTLVFMYSPREGVSLEDFKKFLTEIDQPATFTMPSAKSARILKVLDEGMPYQCIELLEISSFEDWDRDTKNPPPVVQKVLDEWKKYGKVEEMKIYRCEDL